MRRQEYRARAPHAQVRVVGIQGRREYAGASGRGRGHLYPVLVNVPLPGPSRSGAEHGLDSQVGRVREKEGMDVSWRALPLVNLPLELLMLEPFGNGCGLKSFSGLILDL